MVPPGCRRVWVCAAARPLIGGARGAGRPEVTERAVAERRNEAAARPGRAWGTPAQVRAGQQRDNSGTRRDTAAGPPPGSATAPGGLRMQRERLRVGGGPARRGEIPV